MVETTTQHYVEAGDVYAALRRRGVTVPSVDVLIAVMAASVGNGIVTRDRHFEVIREQLPLEVSLIRDNA